jgi:hypothetical protein
VGPTCHLRWQPLRTQTLIRLSRCHPRRTPPCCSPPVILPRTRAPRAIRRPFVVPLRSPPATTSRPCTNSTCARRRHSARVCPRRRILAARRRLGSPATKRGCANSSPPSTSAFPRNLHAVVSTSKISSSIALFLWFLCTVPRLNLLCSSQLSTNSC